MGITIRLSELRYLSGAVVHWVNTPDRAEPCKSKTLRELFSGNKVLGTPKRKEIPALSSFKIFDLLALAFQNVG